MSGGSATPLVSVVISTRNRGDSVTMPIRGILSNEYPNFEIIVVDQSDDDLTRAAIEPFLKDPRVRYIKSSTRGLSAGRNLGISEAKGEWIAMTDDDCEVPLNWLQEFAAALAADQNIALVFGNVLPVRHDPALQFAVSYVRHRSVVARSFRERHLIEGVSACMGLKRSSWLGLGGFDEMLGIGAPLKAAEETDLTIRALLAGYYVSENPAIAVTHHSLISLDSAKIVARRYLYGNGATFAKHLKCARWPVIWYYLRLGWQRTFRNAAGAVVMGPRAHRILKIVSFAQGFLAGAFLPIDRSKGHFINREKRAP